MAFACLLFASCATNKKISYFQDAQNADSAKIALPSPEIRLRTEDKVAIIVNCRDAELSALFILPYMPRLIGGRNGNNISGNTNQGIACYAMHTNFDVAAMADAAPFSA